MSDNILDVAPILTVAGPPGLAGFSIAIVIYRRSIDCIGPHGVDSR